ncbi:MAG: acyl-CoA reductase [Flavobacteriales bacterium]|nr:acyl-CoA reductase [Flavobacteriales bacterium]
MEHGGVGMVQSLAHAPERKAFEQLGVLFSAFASQTPWGGHATGLTETEYTAFVRHIKQAEHQNGWFTSENVRHALGGLADLLKPEALAPWLARYNRGPEDLQRTIGLVLAGNVPLVGFHDLLCVLLAGHRARVKVSSQDAGLTSGVVELLRVLDPGVGARVELVDGRLGDIDAIIATGSDNTARYFHHYFGGLPRMVRQGRVSVAVLDGSETSDELAALGEDVFRYFGLGCRNVAKIYVPQDFDLDRFFGAIVPWHGIIQHHKYANNYTYHKAIWLMDRVSLLENGFLLVKEDEAALASPVGSLYVQRYTDLGVVKDVVQQQAGHIQCVVGHAGLLGPGVDLVPFGQSQFPGPADYADGMDTLKFLLTLPQGVNS